ncbi:P2X purinoceptor 6 isoform X12 [Colius striatus]|uniref:P2X purinoceptor 6 isoform X12 n=1 Tax=Colius striatus TaxID=57412 RepID=UPI002B1E4BAF|nr:P2X purinoceptor 6 isoform X12 [Colius striatus]
MSRWVWKPPKNEPPHPPWAAWTRAPSPQHQRSFSLSGTFCVPAFVHYPLSCHWTPQKNILVNINEILLQSPLLQTKQPRVPQPFLIRKMLQSPGHLGSPALASLQQFPVPLELGSPELDTGLQMRPQQGRAEGEQNLLPTLSEGKQQVSQQAWRQSPSILDAMCTEDADCPMGNPVVHGNGIKTGKCVKFNTSHSTCEIYGWCPVENNTLPRKPLLAEAANFTLFIKNTVHFTKFNFSKYEGKMGWEALRERDWCPSAYLDHHRQCQTRPVLPKWEPGAGKKREAQRQRWRRGAGRGRTLARAVKDDNSMCGSSGLVSLYPLSS